MEQPDWLGASRRATASIRGMLAEHPSVEQRVRVTGTQGAGGDQTLVIDAKAEDAIFAELEALYAQGARFSVVSEERGIVDFGDPGTVVVVDPIDGSLNAKRGLPHHAISIAVAEGSTMADVVFGYVYDIGPGEEWVANRGGGAQLDGRPLAKDVVERRSHRGGLEVLGIESANPRWMRGVADELVDAAYRIRALGAIAVSLCQVAGGRFDGMLTLRPCRAVDAAAAQLIVREAGGVVAFTAFDDPLAAPLDNEPHSGLVAARTAETIAELARIQSVGAGRAAHQ
jgi:myo-inositol-1(or 4)-monophosphatase